MNLISLLFLDSRFQGTYSISEAAQVSCIYIRICEAVRLTATSMVSGQKKKNLKSLVVPLKLSGLKAEI